jgi:RES domain-containing protein
MEMIHMELAKVTSKGRIYLANSSMAALREAQDAFVGEAERLGLQTDDDVVALVKEVRKERAVK